MTEFREGKEPEVKVVKLDLCVKDRKTGKIVCVKDGFEMIVKKRYPVGVEREGDS